jgi:ABC-type bacteriocin/lantibiotic exporter with double-glycine peptidase domain
MSDKIIINNLIFKYGLFLLFGYIVLAVLGFFQLKIGDTIFRIIDNIEIRNIIADYTITLMLNIICIFLISGDLKRQGKKSGLILLLTLVFFLIGIVVFLLQTINDKEKASA